MSRAYTVTAAFDDEAGVWIATSEDVPGLCCEAATLDALVDEVLALVPELLVANGVRPVDDVTDLPVRIVAERRAQVAPAV